MVWIHDWPAGMVIASDPPMEVRCDGVGSGGRASRLPEPAMQRNARGEPTALSAVSSESTRRASPDTETLTPGWSLWRRAMLVAALCAVAALTVGVPGAVARGVLDQTSLPALNEGLSVNDAFEHAQTFTAMRTGFLDTVALSFDQSDQDGRYIVDVVPTDAGGLPAGAPLASRTIDACRVQSLAARWRFHSAQRLRSPRARGTRSWSLPRPAARQRRPSSGTRAAPTPAGLRSPRRLRPKPGVEPRAVRRPRVLDLCLGRGASVSRPRRYPDDRVFGQEPGAARRRHVHRVGDRSQPPGVARPLARWPFGWQTA